MESRNPSKWFANVEVGRGICAFFWTHESKAFTNSSNLFPLRKVKPTGLVKAFYFIDEKTFPWKAGSSPRATWLGGAQAPYIGHWPGRSPEDAVQSPPRCSMITLMSYYSSCPDECTGAQRK